MAARGAGSSYRETSGHAEEAGASLSLTLSSENLPLEGRAEPACRGQRREPEGAAPWRGGRRRPVRPRAGCSGAAGGGPGGGACPRCGAARNPSWRPRGSVSIPERRRTWSRLQGPAAKGPFRGTRLTGWRSRAPRQSRGCDCSAAAAESGAGGGVSRADPWLGAAEAPGLLPCGRLPVRGRGSPSPLTVLLWLWDPRGGLSFSLPGTLSFLRRGGASAPSKLPAPRPGKSLFHPEAALRSIPTPSLATEPPIQIISLLSSHLHGPPSLLPPASDVLTSSNVTYSPIGLSAAQNFNAKEKSGLVSQAF